MNDTSNEGFRPLWLDEDLAQWLHELAEGDHYDGDVQQVMNDCIRACMVAMTEPEDMWAGVSWQARAKAARYARSNQAGPETP